jgi:hypothetical protein
MKTCRRLLASILLALALGVPVWAGDMNSVPTNPGPPPPPAPCMAISEPTLTSAGCSGNVAPPSVEWEAAALVIDLLRSMLSMY